MGRNLVRRAALAAALCLAAAPGAGAAGQDLAERALQLGELRDVAADPALSEALRRVMGAGAYAAARPMLEGGTDPFTDAGKSATASTCVQDGGDKCLHVAFDRQAHAFAAVRDRDVTTFFGNPPGEVLAGLFTREREGGEMELPCTGGPVLELVYDREPTAGSTGERLTVLMRSQGRYVSMRRVAGSPTAPIVFGNRNGYRFTWFTDTAPYRLTVPGQPVRSCRYD